jgi:hypothetical protein
MTYIVQRNGIDIKLSDIKSAIEGDAILDELDQAIVSIEQQIADGARTVCNGGWLIKARTALRYKKLARPKLQARIAELRRQEKAQAAGDLRQYQQSRDNMKRRTFILAAKESLNADSFDQLWAKAREILPDAFTEDGV